MCALLMSSKCSIGIVSICNCCQVKLRECMQGQIMDVFIGGMGQNSETALSYILLGTFAAAMAHTGLADVLAKRISLLIKNNKFILLLILTLLACASQNLIPVHIAFIPVIIPPLIYVMNKLKLDRRAVAWCFSILGL